MKLTQRDVNAIRNALEDVQAVDNETREYLLNLSNTIEEYGVVVLLGPMMHEDLVECVEHGAQTKQIHDALLEELG